MSGAMRVSRDSISIAQGYGRFEGLYLESTECIKSMLIERTSASRGAQYSTRLEDPLERLAKETELPEVESRV